MKLYINNAAEPVEISSYSRVMDIPGSAIIMRLEIDMRGEYTMANFDAFAAYAGQDINAVRIESDAGRVGFNMNMLHARLDNISEVVNDDGQYAHGRITIYREEVPEE